MIIAKTALPSAARTVPALITMEDHDEAYHAWARSGTSDRILFHFDAHIDFDWVAPSPDTLLEESSLSGIMERLKTNPLWSFSGKSDDDRLHLGNYIHQAIRKGIVREFIWIYPDDPDADRQTRAVRSILENLAAAAPQLFQMGPSANAGCFEGLLYGRPFRALPFSGGSKTDIPQENILLDIDLDFFIVQSLHSRYYPYTDPARPRFWISPEAFCEALRAWGLRYNCVTLAYSVEGGYTPLQMKFLGKEVAQYLTYTLDDDARRFQVLRGIFSSQSELNPCSAIQSLENAVRFAPSDASLHFNLALLLLRQGDQEGAKTHYWKAIECDPSYRTRYNHGGPVYESLGYFREAHASYARMKSLDRDNPQYPLGELALLTIEGHWTQGMELGTTLLNAGIEDPLLRLCLSDCFYHLGRHEEAWGQLDPSRPASSIPPHHEIPHFLLKAKVAEQLHRPTAALECYHRLTRLGLHTPPIHLALARLYFLKRNFYKARRHLAKALRLFLLRPFARLLRKKRLQEARV